jgi:EF-P beta-lysylation protein EpmB
MITASHPTRQIKAGANSACDPRALEAVSAGDSRSLAEPWQRELARAITDPRELCALLELDPTAATVAPAINAQFRLLVPRGFVGRIGRGDPDDPLLRQIMPTAAELASPEGYSADPLGEQRTLDTPGLLRKYHGRALLVTTGACAVHCRYCFRREFPYGSGAAGGAQQAALDAIAADASITEVILSGGDPLALTTSRLERLSARLSSIGHLRRLRLHTRAPIVLPERVDEGLCAWLAALPWPCVIVLHCNHAHEIDTSVREACARLRASGATLLNQSVLLAGVNDSGAALEALSEALWSAGVLPYYLHLLDRVRGAAHFEVSEPRARALVADAAARLPGYLLPRLVREVPGAPGKSLIAPAAWPSSE